MVARRQAEATPRAYLERLLRAATDSEVLVGGQALSIWVAKYGLSVPGELSTITRDTDFLTLSPMAVDSVDKFAKAVGGKARFPSRQALTALIGQVEVDISAQEYVNVDVIFQVIGLDPRKVLQQAIRVTFGRHDFLVMHPFDVLRSRLANLHQLTEKQNDKGAIQLDLAIAAAREFLREEAAKFPAAQIASGRSPIQTLVSELEKLALEDAGRKVAKRWGRHVADAIDPGLIPAGPFWARKWPTLKPLMSPAYARRFTPPA